MGCAAAPPGSAEASFKNSADVVCDHPVPNPWGLLQAAGTQPGAWWGLGQDVRRGADVGTGQQRPSLWWERLPCGALGSVQTQSKEAVWEVREAV